MPTPPTDPHQSDPLPPFSVAMLAGGGSTRMGADKSLLDIDLDGDAMGSRILVAALLAGATEVMAVGGSAEALQAQGWRTVVDRWPGEGPLGGIITALEASKNDIVVVVGCDHPTLDPAEIGSMVTALVTALVEETTDSSERAVAPVAAVPVSDGYLYVTHSVWTRRALPQLVAAFEAGERAPSAILSVLPWLTLRVSNRASLRDLDTPQQLEQWRQGTHP